MIQLVVSVILYFVMFFGVAFILNMLLRRTWLMSVLYPFVAIIIIDGIPFFDYFTNTSESFQMLGETFSKLTLVDYIIMGAGFLGTVVSGFVIKLLRKSGYRMF
ncbi:YuiB family protein [Oceanobacillus sp. CAU 1775]